MPNSNEDIGYLVQLKSPEGDNVYPVIPVSALYGTDGELPVRDVREYKVRTGNTITAGTAVNVRPESEGDEPTVFNDTTSTAIALESGNAGDTIKVGFGGYCECAPVKENDEIGTQGNGVYAVSPRDCWLYIEPVHEYLTGEAFSATITVNADVGATVTCALGSSQQSQTATDGSATFTVTSIGEYTITSVSGERNKSVTTNITFDGETKSISLYFALSEYGPDEIAAISEAGNATDYFEIGDTIDIQLSGIGTMTLEIADFDHDYLSGSTSASKAGISFITKNLLYTNYQMNTRNTNVGGFPDSKLYDTLSSTIWNAIPAEWRNVIKTVYKWYGTGNNTNNGEWFGSKIWVPLEYEMFGTTTYSPSTEHSTGNARKYPIFTDNNSRIKKMNNGAGSANWYWEASPWTDYATGFCDVSNSGYGSGNAAGNSYGVCFGLAV